MANIYTGNQGLAETAMCGNCVDSVEDAFQMSQERIV